MSIQFHRNHPATWKAETDGVTWNPVFSTDNPNAVNGTLESTANSDTFIMHLVGGPVYDTPTDIHLTVEGDNGPVTLTETVWFQNAHGTKFIKSTFTEG